MTARGQLAETKAQRVRITDSQETPSTILPDYGRRKTISIDPFDNSKITHRPIAKSGDGSFIFRTVISV